MGQIEQVILLGKFPIAAVGNKRDAMGLVITAIGAQSWAAIDPVANDPIAVDRPVYDGKAPSLPPRAHVHIPAVMCVAYLFTPVGDNEHRSPIGAGVDTVLVIEAVRNPRPAVGSLGFLECFSQTADRCLDFFMGIGHKRIPRCTNHGR